MRKDRAERFELDQGERATGSNKEPPVDDGGDKLGKVTVDVAQFQALRPPGLGGEEKKVFGESAMPGGMRLLLDVPLEVAVELGRSKKPLREVMELGPGSVVELDKQAGDPVDVLVNGKLVARGEVVVVEENFGVRITQLVADSMASGEMGF